MKKTQKIGLAVGALLAAGTLYATPYWALYQIKNGIDNRQADKVASYIDFPSVKEHLKNSLNASMNEKLTQDPHMKGNPFAGFGQMMMAAMIPAMVDALVTPENLGRAMKGQEPTKKGNAAPAADNQEGQAD